MEEDELAPDGAQPSDGGDVGSPMVFTKRSLAEQQEARVNSETGFLGAIGLGWEQTALFSAGRLMQQEGALLDEEWGVYGERPEDMYDDEWEATKQLRRLSTQGPSVGEWASLLGFRAGEADYDKLERYDELVAGIPAHLHDEVLQYDNLGAAMRARGRILHDLETQTRLSQLQGSTAITAMAGSLIDVDLPLMFLTGGGFGAAKLSRGIIMAAERMRVPSQVVRAAQALGATGYRGGRVFSPSQAQRLSSLGVGMNAGLQAGAVVGAADAYWRETTDWTHVPAMALSAMILGGGLNAALKGDAMLAARAAEREFFDRVARNDPNLKEAPVPPDPGNAAPIRPRPVMEAVEEGLSPQDAPDPTRMQPGERQTQDVVESTAGARAIGPQSTVVRTQRPATSWGDTTERLVTEAENWRYTSEWGDVKARDSAEWFAQVATSSWAGRLSGVDAFNQMYKSNAAMLNWFAGNVLESPHGYGRGNYTAATGMEFYHRQIMTPVGNAYTDMLYGWAKRNQQTWQGSGHGVSDAGMRTFNREVMLEINDRAMGRTSRRDPEIMAAADAFDQSAQRAWQIARGEAGQHAVDGFQNVPQRTGYQPYYWNPSKLADLLSRNVVTESNLVDALSRAYQRAGLDPAVTADIAQALVRRMKAGALDQTTTVQHLLTADGREFIAAAMRDAGVPQHRIDGALRSLGGDLHDRGRSNFAKHKNEVDLGQTVKTEDGSTVQLIDLLDHDLYANWMRYARSVSGASALARVGITNRAMREEIVNAVLAEQRALGEEAINPNFLRSFFSHFDGGPVKGAWGDKMVDGIGESASLAKVYTNLALLNKMGIAQTAELGAALAQTGLETWWARSGMAAFNSAVRDSNKNVLDDLAFMLGDIGKDQVHFAHYLQLDELSSKDRHMLTQALGGFGRKAQYVQGYTSLFNQVRSYEQRIAALGFADKVFRDLAEVIGRTGDVLDLDPKLMRRFATDFGLDTDMVSELGRLVDNGTIEFKTIGGRRYVDRLNMDRWDVQTRTNFASGITRHMNQVVQKSMAGESDPWMHTTWGSLFTHLKTFPMLAIQKQFARNMRHADPQRTGAVMYGMATAMLMIHIKDVLEGRERSTKERAAAAFGYSNLTGWIPLYTDPALSMLGLEDWRINPYGRSTSMMPAVGSQFMRAERLPGALIDKITGNADYFDDDAMKALPFYNLLDLAGGLTS